MRNFDENPVVVGTEYTYEQLKKFQVTHLKRYRIIAYLLLIPVALSIILSYLNYYRSPIPYDFPFVPYIVAIVVLVVAVVLLLNGAFYTRSAYDKKAAAYEGGQRFRFLNDGFYLESPAAHAKQTAMMGYSLISRGIETPDMFYLYISSRAAYLISKAGFITGTEEDLRELLSRKVDEKNYRTYRR